MAYKELMVVVARLIIMFDARIPAGSIGGEGNPALAEESIRHRTGKFQGLNRFVLQADGPLVEFPIKRRGCSGVTLINRTSFLMGNPSSQMLHPHTQTIAEELTI